MARPATGKIADRYTISDRLGKGGMGTVWRAEDTLLRRSVAVKEVTFPSSFSPEERESLRARSMREARAAAGLTHPGVVTVYDAIDQDERVYIIMELVDAPTLQDLVDDHGPLPPERAATIGLEILDVLEAAHAAGVVHRDVKPPNVMVPAEGRVKLADFGIAAVTDDPKITGTGLILGSPKFMAPEQATGAAVSPATDMWGLGATLYFIVEGAGPFERGQPVATLTAIVNDAPRAPQKAGPLQSGLDALLEKDPAARPDAARLRAMLQAVAGGGAAAPAATTRVDETTPTEIERESEEVSARPVAPPPERVGPRRALLWAAGLLLVLLALIAAGALLWGGDDARERPQAEREAPADGGDGEGAANGEGGGGKGDGQPEAPEEWERFEQDDPGFAISHPPGWEIHEGSCDEECIDFRDPETGTYLRLDWQSPPSDDAVAAWEQLSASFEDRENYEEIKIEPVSFKGSDNAALWEYTYSEGGADLHAYNLGVGFDDYGFALNFQTRAANWDAQQDAWEGFQESFEPPA